LRPIPGAVEAAGDLPTPECKKRHRRTTEIKIKIKIKD